VVDAAYDDRKPNLEVSVLQMHIVLSLNLLEIRTRYTVILYCGIRSIWIRAVKHLADANYGLRLGDFKELNRIMRVPPTAAKLAIKPPTGKAKFPSQVLPST